LEGVPEGRNFYYDMYKSALEDATGEWGAFWWPAKDILPPEEIAAAQRDLDPVTFDQEYNASFVNFTGRAYYPFSDRIHCARLEYNSCAPLIFCFDFNVAPGVAVVAQEMKLPIGVYGTGCIGEVWIPQGSNTVAVTNKLIAGWEKHEGRFVCYGDATGGAKGSASVKGSDWDLIKLALRSRFGAEMVAFNYPRANPAERARVNAVNTRLMNGAGEVHLMVDPTRCPHLVKDFEGVVVLEGGSGELDKTKYPELTHLTDALGYYVAKEFPIVGRVSLNAEMT